MSYQIEEVATGKDGATFRCNCGFRYLWLRETGEFRDWYSPESEPYDDCKMCGVSLQAIFIKRTKKRKDLYA